MVVFIQVCILLFFISEDVNYLIEGTLVDEIHVVTDRRLVSGQNTTSSGLAAHSFLFLLNQALPSSAK